MKKNWIDWKAATIAIVIGVTLHVTTTGTADDAPDAKKIDAIIGRSGEMNNGVYKIGLPRTDLKVKADGVDIKPTLALGSWMAFKRMGGHTMVMGDLVLLETEINPVLTKLEEKGVEVSAVHNHILNEQPRVMYMHFMGKGDDEQLARALKDALSLSGTPMGPPAAGAPPASTTDWKKVQEALGVQGRERGGVLQVGVPRKEIIRELRKAGIQITALHSHMLDETPRLFFMHFWANDDAVKLAKGLRAALARTDSAL